MNLCDEYSHIVCACAGAGAGAGVCTCAKVDARVLRVCVRACRCVQKHYKTVYI